MLTFELFEYAKQLTSENIGTGTLALYKLDNDMSVMIFGGKSKNTKAYPFPPEMMKEFIDAFELIAEDKKDKVFQEWKKTYKPLSNFVREHCPQMVDIFDFSKKVLTAMNVMLLRHLGSPLHQVIALHQVRSTINYEKNKAGYAKTVRDKMTAREKEAYAKLSRVHALLDCTDFSKATRAQYLERALGVIQEDETLTIKQCKEGLLIAKCYHLSEKSYNKDGIFIPASHNQANEEFLLELRDVQKINTSLAIPPAKKLKQSAHFNVNLHAIDLNGISDDKYDQPKAVSMDWGKAFAMLSESVFENNTSNDQEAIEADSPMTPVKQRKPKNNGFLSPFAEGDVTPDKFATRLTQTNLKKRLEEAGSKDWWNRKNQNSPQGSEEQDERFNFNDDGSSEAGSYKDEEAVLSTGFSEAFIETLKTLDKIEAVNEKDYQATLHKLIDMARALYQAASKVLNIEAPHALQFLQNTDASAFVTLEESYRNMYTLFQAIMFATCLSEKRTTIKKARSHSKDAIAVLLNLVQIDGADSPTIADAHLDMLNRNRPENCTNLLQMLTHHTAKDKFAWSSTYNDPNDIDGRLYYESVCAHVFMQLLKNKPDQKAPVEAQWLIMELFKNYRSQSTQSLFYKALIQLVCVGPLFKTVCLISDNEIQDRMAIYIQQLTSKNPHASLIDSNPTEMGSMQEILENERRDTITKARKVHDKEGSTNDFESNSVGSALTRATNASRQSGFSVNSGKFGGVSSATLRTLQIRSHAKELESAVVDTNFANFYEKFCLSNHAPETTVEPMSDSEINIIISNFENKYRSENANDRKSIPLLHKFFEQSESRFVAGTIVSSGPTMYSQSASTQEAPPVAFIAFVARFSPARMLKNEVPYVFEQYCAYLIQRGGELRPYETQFVLDNLRYLHSNKTDLQEFSGLEAADLTRNKVLELVYPEWNRQLKALEAEGKKLKNGDIPLTKDALSDFSKKVKLQRDRRSLGSEKYIDVTVLSESGEKLLAQIKQLHALVDKKLAPQLAQQEKSMAELEAHTKKLAL